MSAKALAWILCTSILWALPARALEARDPAVVGNAGSYRVGIFHPLRYAIADQME